MNRRVVTILWLLAAGAAINVALAWSLSLFAGFASTEPLALYDRLGEDHHWTVHRWNRFAGTRIVSRTWHGFGGGSRREGEPALLLAGWGTIEVPAAGSTLDRVQLDEAWGFPLRAFACGTGLTSRPDRAPIHTASGIWVLGTPAAGSNRPRYVPVDPLWLGMTVNSLLYALSIMVLVAIGRDLWRHGAAVRILSRGS